MDKLEKTNMKGLCPSSIWLREMGSSIVPNQHQPGAKLDQNKPRAGLVLGDFAKALLKVSEVGTFGANKYTPKGWMEVENGLERYFDALIRHLLLHSSGESKDSESGLSHVAHAAWNVLAIMELEEKNG